jgi:hypothetical protein
MKKHRRDQRSWKMIWLQREIARRQVEIDALKEELSYLAENTESTAKPTYANQRHNFIQSLKRPCERCGESDLRIIEFHHRDPGQKIADVQAMKRAKWSEEQILAEIRKCDCLCPNCHRKLHFD